MQAPGQPLPPWAQWPDAPAHSAWSVGIEEEVLLVDAGDSAPANRSAEIARRVRPGSAGRAWPGLHACVITLSTAPRPTVAEAGRDLGYLRAEIVEALGAAGGARAAASGTHPTAVWQDAVSPGPRYHFMHASLREVARREPTAAMRVHVAVPDPDAAIRAYRGLCRDVPVLLALSANSPYWQGRDSGLASARTAIHAAFPRVGLPRAFGSYSVYVSAVEALLRCGAIPDPSFLWWDVRLRPRTGTVEVRVMDAQSSVRDAVALAALVQCRARLHALTAAPPQAVDRELLEESRFLAARDGIDGRLADTRTHTLRSAQAQLADVLADCALVANELGCSEQLDGAARLAGDAGHARQRRIAARDGMDAVLPELVAEFRRAPAPLAAA